MECQPGYRNNLPYIVAAFQTNHTRYRTAPHRVCSSLGMFVSHKGNTMPLLVQKLHSIHPRSVGSDFIKKRKIREIKKWTVNDQDVFKAASGLPWVWNSKPTALRECQHLPSTTAKTILTSTFKNSGGWKQHLGELLRSAKATMLGEGGQTAHTRSQGSTGGKVMQLWFATTTAREERTIGATPSSTT